MLALFDRSFADLAFILDLHERAEQAIEETSAEAERGNYKHLKYIYRAEEEGDEGKKSRGYDGCRRADE